MAVTRYDPLYPKFLKMVGENNVPNTNPKVSMASNLAKVRALFSSVVIEAPKPYTPK